uniref:Uncharacterized protein n=1 Tax=Romanomermis culicivorax TaxID=13658 RepID=A0A915LBX1_ROMCU
MFCFNDGHCAVNRTGHKGYCECKSGWSGESCDKKDFCLKHKCEHNSVCINGPLNYTCSCKGEFSGHFCEVACPPSLCSNNGKCSYENGAYKCFCKPGFTGDRCEINIDECASNPCQNNAVCMDRINGYFCKCKTGFMGQKCHRPCRDVYRQYCPKWKVEGLCELSGNNTFYSENCALSCGACTRKKNVTRTVFVIPPYLEPLDFLVGKWTTNSTDSSSFPLGFESKQVTNYYEEMELVPGDKLLFGQPSLNYSSLIIAHTRNGSQMTIARAGLVSIRYNDTEPQAVWMSFGDEGLTVIEQGSISSKEVTLQTLSITYESSKFQSRLVPTSIKRSLAISGDFLRESLERTFNDSMPEFHTKYYTKAVTFELY